MDSPSSSMASRRRTFDLPKSSPDAGLAEWTSKIKAIQQEVDRDEEVEQRRLQEEIAQSRLERARRRNTATGSIDWTKSDAPPTGEPKPEAQAQATMDLEQHQSDAFKKLSGSVVSLSGSINTSVSSSRSSTSKEEGVSLAAFMGGKATGPRFNKPAPQVDSHDPVLFDQTRRQGPHPVFGRPSESLAATSRFASKAQTSDIKKKESGIDINSTPNISNAPVTSPASAVTSGQTASEVARPPPGIPKKPDILRKPSDKIVHTIETFRGVEPSPRLETPPDTSTKPKFPRPQPQQQQSYSGDSLRSSSVVTTPPKPTSLAEVIGGRASAPRLTRQPDESLDVFTSSSSRLSTQGRALPGMSGTSRVKSPPTMPSPSPKPILSHSSSQQDVTSHTPSPDRNTPQTRSMPGSPIVTPSLARPVQPQVAVQPSLVAAASSNPSPAFLRVTPSTQDLHPSLSRLHGRRFVEERVKASSQLYNGTPVQQRDRSTSSGSPGQRPPVLERWQPNMASASPSQSPSASKLSSSQQEVLQTPLDTTPSKSTPQVIVPRIISPSPGLFKPKTEVAEQERETPVRLPGMTNADSLPKHRALINSSVSSGSAHADRAVENQQAERPHDMSRATGPLSHPTRDRARKPRKASGPPALATKKDLSEPMPPNATAVSEVPKTSNANGSPQVGLKGFKPPQRLPSPKAETQPLSSAMNNIQQLKDTLTYQPPREVQLPPSSSPAQSRLTDEGSSASATSHNPLPAISRTTPPPLVAPRPTTPASPSSGLDELPMTPSRHSRIPSTGQRATVMDVAQALQQHEQHIRETSWTPEPEPESQVMPDHTKNLSSDDGIDETPRTDVKAAIAGWGRTVASGNQQPERRRSSYDRFCVPTLPPLVEEKTPVPTPQGSLSKGTPQVEQSVSMIQEYNKRMQASVPESTIPAAAVKVEQLESTPDPKPELEQDSVSKTKDSLVHLEHHDRLPPAFNLQSVLKEVPFSSDLTSQTISVEVFSLSGHLATAVTREPNVFYDSEVIAVIHRAKELSGQLVSSKVWIWQGTHAIFGENEQRKATELAERFGTTGISCSQGSEPPELIHMLGGVLAIRQGARAHWSSENTAMHRVHCVGDSIFVDEIDLHVSNLCSAYSYCLSILGALYVWHGRGASEDERKVAQTYGRSLMTASANFLEFEEGQEDQMFWMILGNDGYANADHWKFRGQLDRLGARVHVIDSSKSKSSVQTLLSISAQDLPDDCIFVVDCRLEMFIVVSPAARGRRTDIRLALILAENIAVAAAAKRPFDPPVHVVILPSQLPNELRACLRLCDEEKLNGGSVPDHMNLVPLPEAMDHMQQRSWHKSFLADPTFLPLGVTPSMF